MATGLPERAYTQWMLTNHSLYQTRARSRQLERLGPVRPLEDEDSAPGRARGLLWSFGLSKSTITASLQEHSQYSGYPYRVAGQSRLVLAGEVPGI